MPTKQDFYTISREEAATTLGVSTRTLDRYLKDKKLKYKTIGRSVFVHSGELAKLVEKLKAKRAKSVKKNTRPKHEPTRTAEPIVTVENNTEEKIFRELYTDSLSELRGKQEKLEAASFRVGQLEAQLKNSVPLLEYKQKEDELQQENNKLKQLSESTRLRFMIAFISAIVFAVTAVVLAILTSL